jgi:hypothetical protein
MTAPTPKDWAILARFGITPENHKTLTYVDVWNCPGLTALPDLPAATHVDVYDCLGLIRIGDLPVATSVDVWNCPGLAALYHDPRGYALIRIGDRYFAGCRNFTAAEAIAHWGAPDYRNPERGAAYVAAVKAEEERRKRDHT